MNCSSSLTILPALISVGYGTGHILLSYLSVLSFDYQVTRGCARSPTANGTPSFATQFARVFTVSHIQLPYLPYTYFHVNGACAGQSTARLSRTLLGAPMEPKTNTIRGNLHALV